MLIIKEELALCFDRWILITFKLLLLRLFQGSISDIKHSGRQVVLKTVILVFPINIIVIKVGDVLLLPYSNIFPQHYEFESEMFRLLSFKFLLMIL